MYLTVKACSRFRIGGAKYFACGQASAMIPKVKDFGKRVSEPHACNPPVKPGVIYFACGAGDDG